MYPGININYFILYKQNTMPPGKCTIYSVKKNDEIQCVSYNEYKVLYIY